MQQVPVPLAGAIATYSAKSALFTAAAADRGTFFDCTGSFTVSLTAAATLGAGWSCWVRNVSGTQTIDPNGAELINGAATYAVSNAGDVVLIECTGSAFVVSHSQIPSTVKITGGTLVGVTLSGATSIGGALSGTTISNATISGGTIGGATVSGSTWVGGTISGATIVNPTITGGSMNATTIGATTASTGAFTTLTASTGVTFPATTASTSRATGTLIIGTAGSGGLGVGGAINAASIKFADAGTTLANYEEGTWTPTVAGSSTAGSQTYSERVGRYTRIGRKVFVAFNITINPVDAATNGTIEITGLPFTANSAVDYAANISIAINITFGDGLAVRALASTTKMRISKLVSAGSSSDITQADISLGGLFRAYGAGTYEI